MIALLSVISSQNCGTGDLTVSSGSVASSSFLTVPNIPCVSFVTIVIPYKHKQRSSIEEA